MRKPQKPLPMDCCGTGCSRCIYDIYEEHLAKYKEWKKQQQEDSIETNANNSSSK